MRRWRACVAAWLGSPTIWRSSVTCVERSEAQRRVRDALLVTFGLYITYGVGRALIPAAAELFDVALIAGFYVIPVRMTRDIPQLAAADDITVDRLFPVFRPRGWRVGFVASAVFLPLFALAFWAYYARVCGGDFDVVAPVIALEEYFGIEGGLRQFYSGLCRRHSGDFWPAQFQLPSSWTEGYGLGFARELVMGIFVVALPEELFHRAYLMGTFERLWPARWRLFGVGMGLAVLLSSALFAVGHLAGVGHTARLATFFPALAFAWLWRYSGSLWAPTIFHVASNLAMDLLMASTFPRGG